MKRSTVIIFIRIAARVDQLMSLCDKLEAALMRSQADSERLMEVMGRMLAGGDSALRSAALNNRNCFEIS